MGISNLLPHIRDAERPTNIAEFSGMRIAVDTYVWLHRGVFAAAADLCNGNSPCKSKKFMQYAISYIKLLQANSITPIMVFDGGHLPSKALTEEKRALHRAESLSRGKMLKKRGKHEEAMANFRKAVDISPKMARALQKKLEELNIEYIVAPYEADCQLAYLARTDYVDAIITEDSDLLLYGTPKPILYKLNRYGDCACFDPDWITHCRSLPMTGWKADRELRLLGILVGCDYCDGVSGLGIKKAYRIIRQYLKPGASVCLERLIRIISMEKSTKVPDDFERKASLALLTFAHQQVYCPVKKKNVPCTPVPENLTMSNEEDELIGKRLDTPIAQRVAKGLLNPMTYEPFSAERSSNQSKNLLLFADNKENTSPIKRFFRPEQSDSDRPISFNKKIGRTGSSTTILENCATEKIGSSRTESDKLDATLSDISEELHELPSKKSNKLEIEKQQSAKSDQRENNYQDLMGSIEQELLEFEKNVGTQVPDDQDSCTQRTIADAENPLATDFYSQIFTESEKSNALLQSESNLSNQKELKRKLLADSWIKSFSFQPCAKRLELEEGECLIASQKIDINKSTIERSVLRTNLTISGRYGTSVRSQTLDCGSLVSLRKSSSERTTSVLQRASTIGNFKAHPYARGFIDNVDIKKDSVISIRAAGKQYQSHNKDRSLLDATNTSGHHVDKKISGPDQLSIFMYQPTEERKTWKKENLII